MIFTSVEIQNFLHIMGPIGIQLKDQGLVLIHGENGAGKSTIFEAIVWCLWGRTVRGYKHDQVINNQVKKDCWVRLKIEHEGETYAIERYRGHSVHKNDLHFMHYSPQGPADMSDGTPTMTQSKIEEWLGVDFDTYTRGPMVGQGNFKRFSQMTDAEQKAILETALQIDILSRAKKKAKEKSDAININLAKAAMEYDASVQRVEGVEEKIEAHEGLLVTALKDHRRTTAAMYLSIADAGMLIEGAWEYRDALEEPDLEGLTATKLKITELHTKLIEKHTTDLEAAKQVQWTTQSEHIQGRRDRDAVSTRLKKIQEQKVGECPTCLQDVAEEHLAGCESEIQTELRQADQALEALFMEQQDANEAVVVLQESQKPIRERADAMKLKAEEAVAFANTTIQNIEYWQNEVDKNTTDRETYLKRFLAWQKRPMITGLHDREALEQELVQAGLDRDALGTKVKELEVDLEHMQFWTQGFGNSGLKSLILDSIVPFLNERARIYAQDLADGNVRIEFSTRTKQKDGKEVERFQVLVDNVEGADDYMGNSGGERARIDLAINFSLSDLMATRAKKAFPQRFFDEPFEGMDVAGLEAVMDLLARMTQECGTIFVVTHTPALSNLFNKVIHVVKQNGQTTLKAA